MRLHDIFDWMAREHGDIEFAVDGDRRLTYAEAWRETNRLANGLTAAGLGMGDRWAILAKNSIDFLVAYLAAAKSGAVLVPLNYRLAPAEWAYILNDAGARVLIAQEPFARALAGPNPELPPVELRLVIGGPAPVGFADYRGWLSRQPDHRPADGVTGDADLYQMYTSGTTGRPKGAVLTHRNIVANAEQLRLSLSAHLNIGDRQLVVLPIFHAAAGSQIFFGFMSGTTLVLHADFDPASVVRALTDDDIAQVTMVPALIRVCVDYLRDHPGSGFPSLRALAYGASPIDPELLRAAVAAFGCAFAQGFGQTESSAVLTCLTDQDHARALAEDPGLLLSAGRPIPGTEVRVVGPDHEDLPAFQAGEIIARGPQVMRGYWQMPDANARTLAGGWLHTGDIGMIDDEGYLFLLDRKHDMIVSGGENVYPREVETALLSHPLIADAAVIGIPDPKFGETVMAFVVPRPGAQLTTEAVLEHCRPLIGGYKLPRRVEFLEALPRNATGKILKTELRQPFWAGRERRIAG
jgi:acyl-CoA synthetase (AMP-forming)/AMP-acid ligase II